MIRNTKTTAGMLKQGDRFYKCGDRKRKVWEVRSFGAMVTVGDANIRNISYPERMRTETEVIFLRHNDAD